MKLLRDTTEQKSLFNFSFRDLVDKDSDVWLYIDLFDELDYFSFESIYNNQGQVPLDPKLMLRTIFYGLTHGVVSGWKLEAVCRNDNRFIVLSGNRRPDKRTFHRFIERHSSNMDELFVKVVELAQEMDLVNLGRVAIDGTRFKGKTSAKHSMKYGNMPSAMKHIEVGLKSLREDLAEENKEENTLNDKLEKEISDRERRIAKIRSAKEKIEKEYEEKKDKSKNKIEDMRKSLNDSDAQSLAHKSSTRGHMFGYNVQAAVEESNQIIVAAGVHNKPTDYEALPGLLDDIEDDYNDKVEEVLGDLGYKSVKNLKELEKRRITPYIATGSDEYKDVNIAFSEQLEFTGEKHIYKCLSGRILPLFARRRDGRTEFKITTGFCDGCPHQSECQAFGKKTISIMSEENRLLMNRLLERSRTEEFKDVYRKRKFIIEPVFGNIKNKGMKILVTGYKKVSTWWKMACTAHNVGKIINHMAQVRV